MDYFQKMVDLKKRFFSYSFKKLLPFINLKRLKDKYFGLKKENFNPIEDKFDGFIKKVQDENLIFVKGVYRFFKTKKEGDSIFVFYKNKKIEFPFPRQVEEEKLSISDFIKSEDIICFFVLTAGIGVKKRAENLRKNGEFLFSYLLEILSIEGAEAGAEILNIEIGKKFKFYGKRYSFGYPSCPDLSLQKKLFEILKPEKIGIILTENYMMDPESSISGFIIKNLKAKYFNLEKK